MDSNATPALSSAQAALALVENPNPRAGDVLDGRYRLIEPLARGGMGMVYRAERLELGRIVAVKFLLAPLADEQRHMRNFEMEARAMSRLSHPNCVPIIDFGVDRAPYLVMEFVAGKTLKDLIHEGPIAWERALGIARQLLAGLAHAHRQNIVHRDIKPGNIMLTQATGMGDHVRVLDFGLARMRESAAPVETTCSETVWGTPQYMAPEQWRSEPLDARTDLYAVGVVLYEMLAGQRPYPGSDRVELMKSHLSEPPPPIRQRKIRRSMPEALERVLARALQKSPDARFQSAEEFSEALGFVLHAHAQTVRAPAQKVPPPRPTAPSDSGQVSRSQPSHSVAPPGPARAWKLPLVVFLLAAATYVGWLRSTAEPEKLPTLANPLSDLVDTSATGWAGASSDDALERTAPDAAHVEALGDLEPQDQRPLAAEPDEVQEEAAPQPQEQEPSAAEQAVADVLAEVTARVAEVVDNEPSEPVPTPAPVVQPTPSKTKPAPRPALSPIASARAMIARGEHRRAIRALQRLRAKQPKNAQLPFLIGTQYYELGWWSDALRRYREAIRLDKRYRRRHDLQDDVIGALSLNRTRRQAARMLRTDIGRAALPRLLRASRRDKRRVVRDRARMLYKRIKRSR